MNKEKILADAKNHLEKVGTRIQDAGKQLAGTITRDKAVYTTLTNADKIVADQVQKYNEKRVDELAHLQGSPYFVRCDVIYDQEEAVTSLYFGKFGFQEESIYSWVVPASGMRFENPGQVSYRLPDGKTQAAQLLRKDQYMITHGQLKFLSTETTDESRQLVFQEYFSNRKTSFALPEIVAQMEKAQDQVIRAHHVGPFLISGPAGSGKTTLALHRVAYLTQSPDLSDKYPSKSIIVFVQDQGTKKYFSQLLPELGINDVQITTFPEWALAILKINVTFSPRYGANEEEKDLYELAKLAALRKHRPTTDIGFPLLEKIYATHFDARQQKMFRQQKLRKTLDKIDLTLLLKNRLEKNRQLERIEEYLVETQNGQIIQKQTKTILRYSLAVIDEFQNYLPAQLQIINSCLDEKNKSTLYVGDMAQQVHFGTLKHWDEINEDIHQTRQVVLSKVYRNTKNILTFIQGLGYSIELPEGLKDGPPVAQLLTSGPAQEMAYIQKTLAKSQFQSAGIIAKEQSYLTAFATAFSAQEKIHIMTMNEAQGVEFDMVFLVGMSSDLFQAQYTEEMPQAILDEKRKINRDLLYVALTRAISELHILGKDKLQSF